MTRPYHGLQNYLVMCVIRRLSIKSVITLAKKVLESNDKSSNSYFQYEYTVLGNRAWQGAVTDMKIFFLYVKHATNISWVNSTSTLKACIYNME